MQEPRIETLPAIPLVGLATTFVSALSEDSTAAQTIGPLWGGLIERLGEIAIAEEGALYGWTWILPPDQRSRPDELGYLAGAHVAPGAPVPEGMVSVEAAGGMYAVFEHHGPLEKFHDTVLWVYRDWLPNSPYEGNGKGDLERYDERWSPTGEDSIFDFRVGIRPKQS